MAANTNYIIIEGTAFFSHLQKASRYGHYELTLGSLTESSIKTLEEHNLHSKIKTNAPEKIAELKSKGKNPVDMGKYIVLRSKDASYFTVTYPSKEAVKKEIPFGSTVRAQCAVRPSRMDPRRNVIYPIAYILIKEPEMVSTKPDPYAGLPADSQPAMNSRPWERSQVG